MDETVKRMVSAIETGTPCILMTMSWGNGEGDRHVLYGKFCLGSERDPTALTVPLGYGERVHTDEPTPSRAPGKLLDHAASLLSQGELNAARELLGIPPLSRV